MSPEPLEPLLEVLTADPAWMLAGARRPRLPRAVSAWLGLPRRERWRWLGRKLGELVRGGNRIDSPDRVVLERVVLPRFAADPALGSLLFVGCGRYTRHYASLFAPETGRFRTIDIDPRRARFGSAGHIVAPLQDVARHLPAGSVDAVVCNGVYGFGIYEREELVEALRASRSVLRPGGALVLGWNDVPAYAPFDPVEVALAAGFVRDSTLLDTWRVTTDTPTRHTFDTYVRDAAA